MDVKHYSKLIIKLETEVSMQIKNVYIHMPIIIPIIHYYTRQSMK